MLLVSKVDHLFWLLLLSVLALLGFKIAALAVPVYLAVLILQGRFIK
jgi:hypothetical protein